MESIPLAPEDRAILALESETVAGHTCKLIELAPGAPDLEELRGIATARIERVPELARRLDQAGPEPCWVDDELFDLAAQIGPAPVDGPLGRAGLAALVATLFERRLDRDRPLWRIDRVELEGGGAALIWRIHHALADGTASIRIAGELLWDIADVPHRATQSRARSAVDDSRRRRHLAALLRREFLRSPERSPFDGEIGRRRQIAFAKAPLRALHDASRQLAGATLNDAVLSVLAGALGRWMSAQHGELGQIRVKVPVSLHHEGDQVANRDSFFSVPLPVNEADVVTRLRDVKMATTARKQGHDAEKLDELSRGLGRVSPRLAEFCDRIEHSPRRFALNVSNVPGPRSPVTLGGAPVTGLHSIAEIGEHHALRVTAVSLCDELCFGFCADPALVSELEAMADGVEVEVAALLEAAEQRGAGRRSMR